MRALSSLLLVAIAAGGLGCVLVGPPPGVIMPAPELHPGPPPHAAAWGARRRHRGERHAPNVALRFDPDLGVDLVVGRTGVYFDGSVFLRFSSGVWQSCVTLGGPWRRWDARRVPPGLRARYRRSPRGRGRGHERREDRGEAHPDWD